MVSSDAEIDRGMEILENALRAVMRGQTAKAA
jgi:hypothetical protein